LQYTQPADDCLHCLLLIAIEWARIHWAFIN
jgi:hypothetical protein